MLVKKSAESLVVVPPVEQRRDKTKLHPQYVTGFVDGEGCFAISISRHATLKRRREVRASFQIELRADDHAILERIREILDCGQLYHLRYDRYGWYPHNKFKVSRIEDLVTKIIPFFDC